jgi:hypothetical protein
MCMAAEFEILFFFEIAREVNAELTRRGQKPITRGGCKQGFFNFNRSIHHIFKKHEELFLNSSKRTGWVLSNVLLAFAFIVADIACNFR